MASCDVKL